MIGSVRQAKKIASEFNMLTTLNAQLNFLQNNAGNLKVVLDYDKTMVGFDIVGVEDDVQEDAISEIEMNSLFVNYGKGDHISTLFKRSGIGAEEANT